jgi:hypothetical protein
LLLRGGHGHQDGQLIFLRGIVKVKEVVELIIALVCLHEVSLELLLSHPPPLLKNEFKSLDGVKFGFQVDAEGTVWWQILTNCDLLLKRLAAS